MSIEKSEKLPDQSWRATEEAASFEELETFLVDEIFKNSGLNPEGVLRRIMGWIFRPYIRKIVQKATEFDQAVAKNGFSLTAREWITKWTPGIQVHGVEKIPASGPFLITTNHPGTYDSLVVIASLQRKDFKVIVSANPFFRILPHTREWFIFTTRDPHVRMATLRRAIRFLEEGGLLVVFPSGKLEPDPAYYRNDALNALSWWSDSAGLLVRRNPVTGVSVAINSSVNDPKYLKHPLARLRSKDYDRQKVAEFLQVVDLLIRDKKVTTSPEVIFSDPIWPSKLQATTGGLQDEILKKANILITQSPAKKL